MKTKSRTRLVCMLAELLVIRNEDDLPKIVHFVEDEIKKSYQQGYRTRKYATKTK